MKKYISLCILIIAVVIAGFSTQSVHAAKTKCTSIQNGSLVNGAGEIITVGNDIWGYNYQAKMFNGTFCGAYRDAPWCTALPYKDISLMMKWNNAWLSNQDCDGDKLLDRHYGFLSYIGSGAWLTNHATGTYTSAIQHNWNITGVYDVVFTLDGGDYPHTATITQTGTSVSGVLAYPGYSKTIISGSVIGKDVNMIALYSEGGEGTVQLIGTIADDGSISGSWTDSWPVADGSVLRNGTWSTTLGVAHKVYDITCTINDFVKVVAVPESAYLDETVLGYYGEGMWYEYNGGPEIGPALWGEFAVIQEISDDPCGEYDAINYASEGKKGLGNW